MKNLHFIPLSLLALLISCNQETTKKTDSSKNDKTEKKENETKEEFSIQKLTSKKVADYSGYYINDDFLNKVEKEKSVYKAGEIKGKLMGFSLSKDEIKTGGGIIYGHSRHEGGMETHIVWSDKMDCFTNQNVVGDYDYIKVFFDMVLMKNGNIELQFEDSHTEIYRKTSMDDSELRRILFAGNYSDFQRNKYVFHSNGKLEGFSEGAFHNVLYDFGEGLNFDVVFFSTDKQMNDEKPFHYLISGDTLKLFEVNGEVPEFEIGELKYLLIKE